jgi:hypothetical protein
LTRAPRAPNAPIATRARRSTPRNARRSTRVLARRPSSSRRVGICRRARRRVVDVVDVPPRRFDSADVATSRSARPRRARADPTARSRESRFVARVVFFFSPASRPAAPRDRSTPRRRVARQSVAKRRDRRRFASL